MDTAMRRRETAGITLVELLVVLGVIAIISAVTIPVAIQGGWFTPSRSAFAARELFTLEKAARVYASTYNVETAVAYGGVLINDSELASNPCVPVVDTVILARRLKRDELIQLGLAANSKDIFVPLNSEDGAFRVIPKQMVILPDVFAVDANGVSKTGLAGLLLYDINAPGYLEPRTDSCNGLGILDYTLDSYSPLDTPPDPPSFPAHRFLPDGSLNSPEGIQRFHFRVGARPDALYKDRFFSNPDSDVISPQTIAVVFNEGTASMPSSVDMNIVDDSNPETIDYVDISTTIELYRPTGRVKMVP